MARISVQKAYRKRSKLIHPDRTTEDQFAKEKFQVLQRAYSVLHDTRKRQMYDAVGSVNCDDKPFVFIVPDDLLNQCKQSYEGEQ